MKNKILKILTDEGGKSFKELRIALGLSYKDNRKLDKVLRELWTERKIYYKKSQDKYNVKNDEEVIGTFKDTKNDYGFVENDEITVFIPGKFVLNALEGDSVKVILFPLREDDDPSRRAGKIVRVMQRNGSSIVGRIFIEKGKKKFIPDDIFPKYEYVIEDMDKYQEGDILLTKFIDFENRKITLKVIKEIGMASNAKLDPEIIGYKFNLNTEFPKKVLTEVEKLNYDEKEKTNRRKDISNRLVYTIDGIESKDLDDAIDVTKLKNGNYKLGVHIADVSHFVTKNSEIDIEAEERGTSVYLIDSVFPMLPQKLSNDLCSLNPNTLKYTLTCDMEINIKGEVIKSEIYESKIISKHRLSYEQVDKLYNGEDKLVNNDEKLTKSLLDAKELSELIRKIKIKNGMIDFVLPEAKLKLDENGEVIEIKNKFQSPSEKVIEDLMVVTNETVAKTLTCNELPGIFRVHPKPKLENLEKFNNLAKILGTFLPKSIEKIESNDLMNFLQKEENNENGDILKRYMIQSMEKAIYDYEDKGHYALGLTNYLHFTSPIRRYPDLVVHRLLKLFFLDKEFKKNQANKNEFIFSLKEIADNCSEKEKIAVSSERKIADIKKSRFMKSMIGSELIGKIISVVKFGFFVEFENFTQGLVHIDTMKDDEYLYDEVNFLISGAKNKKVYKLGEKVKVKIINVDIIKGLIDLEVK
ncbi:MAG: ribonuclease R [Candidatus Tyloplasma litorale]|nr:MAG: ribonuclease R [Mycoplasmatales bacterium]